MTPRTFQAITTKFIPATNTKPARVKATTEAGSVIVSFHTDKSETTEERHIAAAKALAEKFGWGGHWYSGGTRGGFVFVCPDYPAGFPDKPFATFATFKQAK